jgi:hypothetical protein
MPMTFFIPSTIDFDAIETTFPPTFKPYKRDKLAYLLHKIASLAVINKNIAIKDGYVPLYSPAMQNIVKNYRQYLQYAERAGIILIKESYLNGKFSKSYRFVVDDKMSLVDYKVTDFTLMSSLKRFRNEQKKTVAKHAYLTKWFNNKLTIDYRKVEAFLEEEWLLKNDNEALWDYDLSRKIYKSPYLQLHSAKLASEFLVRGEYNLKIDTNVHRFHSNLTNMRSLIRNAVTYGGQNLVSIDIKNSQPYFSSLLLRKAFWSGQKKSENELFCNYKEISLNVYDPRTSFKGFNSNKLIKFNTIRDRISSASIIMLGETMETHMNKGLKEDLNRFVDLVVAGRLYEYLETAFKRDLKMVDVTRNSAKIAVLQAFFSDNRFIGTEDAKLKRCFKDLFPSVYSVYATIKRKDKKLLALLLQNIESYFIIDVITKRIAKEYPNLPIFTIHDSIVTTVGNEALVAQIMKEELEQGVGKAPSLKYEYWESKNIDTYLTDLKVRAGLLSA